MATPGPTTSGRIRKIETGTRVNLWGDDWNTNLDLLDDQIDGYVEVALDGSPRSLTSANWTEDESRCAIIRFIGTGGGTVTAPSVSKRAIFWNSTSGPVTITAGGTPFVIDPGDVEFVFCDGSNIRPAIGYADSGGNLLSLKDYIAAQALASPGGPGVVGNAGKFRFTNGAVETWQFVTTALISDYAVDRAALRSELMDFAEEMALIL